MSLLPVFAQPPRVRHESSRPPVLDRNAHHASRDVFADSYAVALRGPTASLPAVPETVTPPQTHTDANIAAAGVLRAPIARPDDEAAAVEATESPLIALPMDESGELEIIEIRSDGPVYRTIAPAALPVRTGTATQPVAPAAAASSMIEAVADDEHDAIACADTPPEDSVSESQAAVAAGAPLVMMLPPLPVTLPATPQLDSVSDEPVRHDAAAPLSTAPRSVPDVPDTAASMPLVEDHFDANAATLHAHLGATSTPSAAPSEPTETSVTAPHATRVPAGPIPVLRTAVERDLARLDPTFRERLERVMDRMRQEFGHDVTVVETVRSQTRQNALFAQGRTAPGPVVTWTRNSRHLTGLAADVQVDGTWQNPLGYMRLADIARQEGLRTLGARDPGHVELPTDASVASETLGTLLGDLHGEAGDAARKLKAELTQSQVRDTASRANRLAQVSNVAQVARVATVANVARVAEVARPGDGRSAAPAVDVASTLSITPVAPAAGATDLAGAMRVATPAAGVNMSDRITQLLDLQATQASKPLNSVLLRMENGAGADDQIRIDTRGSAVDARLGLGNAQQAAALTDRLGELREALERRGLTADSVRVQAAAGTRQSDSVTLSRSTAPVLELAAMRAMSDSQAQSNLRDQSARDQQQREAFARDQARHTPRPSSDDPRHRSRREQPEDRR